MKNRENERVKERVQYAVVARSRVSATRRSASLLRFLASSCSGVFVRGRSENHGLFNYLGSYAKQIRAPGEKIEDLLIIA